MKSKKIRRIMRHEIDEQAKHIRELVESEAEKARQEMRGRIAPKPWWLPFKVWEFLLRKLLVDYSLLKGGEIHGIKND